MNGINYNTLLGNTGLFSQQTNTVADELKYKGTSTKEKTTDKKQTNADRDTVEINGEAGQLQKAGYDRPKCTVRQQQTSKYKQIDENGIQEGVQLSSAAKKLLKELKAKYSNMEISVAEWSSDEEQDYYASKCTKDYSVLISPEALEQMAADESVREKYEAILDGAGESSKKMQEEQMKLYQEENINPGASCLPMFLQFFILFGILDVVYKPLSFILKMKDSVISSAFEIVRNVNPELAKQGTSLRRELAILSAQHSDASAFQSVLGDNLSGRKDYIAENGCRYLDMIDVS